MGNGKNGGNGKDLSAAEVIHQETTEAMESEAVYAFTDMSGTNISARAFVRDADENPTGAFQSVQDSLKAVGLPAPARPFERFSGEPRVMVIILPDEGKTGALEDLCLGSVKEDAILYRVEQHFECLKEQNVSLPKNPAKAKVQVFLGSKKDSGIS